MLINQLEYQLKYQNLLMRPFVYPQIFINHVIIFFFLLINISKRILISIMLVLVYVSIFYHSLSTIKYNLHQSD